MQQAFRHSAILLLAISGVALAQDHEMPAASFWSGEEFSFGDLFYPHLHVSGAVGASSEGDIASLSSGAHDPSQNVNLLALEPGLSLRLGDHIEGFVTSSYRTDEDSHFTGGIEEAFLKLKDLPGGFELRGGRFFNRVGFQNALHNHAWDYVDQNLVNGRILQEGELGSVGAELTWYLPTRYPSALSIGVGGPPGGHAHGHEGEHDDDHDDHGDEDHEEEEHFDAEGANFDDFVVTANLTSVWRYNDFHQYTGNLNFSTGENTFGETTNIFGLGLEYLWRENGLQGGGRAFRWRTEAFYRDIDAVHEEEEGAEIESFDEFGIYTSATYTFDERLEASLRLGYVEGIGEFELGERWRISPALTWSLNPERSAYMRLQYNYDHRSDLDDAHTVWLGFGFNWGGSEVR